MVNFREAQETITSKARTFGSEIIDLNDAEGRILDEDILADRDYPPFNRSAMDGYAIRLEDWTAGIREFRIKEVIFAGNLAGSNLENGCCYKIMTGAAVPLDADAVIRREDSSETDCHVSFTTEEITKFQNIARKGEDLKQGTLAIQKDTLCNAPVVSTLATLGKTTIKVKKLPRIAFFTTGNEVKPVGSDINEIQIRNSNEWLVKSLLKSWQIKPQLYKHLPDDKTQLSVNIEEALSFDILIMSGGVSAGDADYVPEILQSLGVKKLFHKVAIKPGKPFWCGEMPAGGLVFALPGNPFSTLVTFKLFIETFLSKSLQQSPTRTLHLPFTGKRVRKSGFDEFFPVKIEGNPSKIEPVDINGSGDIRLGLYADAIAHHPKENPELSPGILLTCLTI
ncbi:molybdopterin molybdotransferase MoeA [Desertivirga arenae]|uniref:molybdopterin molybdotransferase MoeA n=1 Tax=Desertivirga arenae TaxID=2810309 RepID=UPI001A974C1F|nr:molybdopterin molybdotransferase MoeA [Pedobacter sp. SYSU D00823]